MTTFRSFFSDFWIYKNSTRWPNEILGKYWKLAINGLDPFSKHGSIFLLLLLGSTVLLFVLTTVVLFGLVALYNKFLMWHHKRNYKEAIRWSRCPLCFLLTFYPLIYLDIHYFIILHYNDVLITCVKVSKINIYCRNNIIC